MSQKFYPACVCDPSMGHVWNCPSGPSTPEPTPARKEGVRVERIKANWVAVEFHGRTMFMATDAEARELLEQLRRVLEGDGCSECCLTPCICLEET